MGGRGAAVPAGCAAVASRGWRLPSAILSAAAREEEAEGSFPLLPCLWMETCPINMYTRMVMSFPQMGWP